MRTINKALFLDLDGTLIITKSGGVFAKDKDDWQFNGSILTKVEEYVDRGYYILIVSNQGGIESGVVSLNDFRQKIRKVINEIIVHTGCPISRVGHRFTVTNNNEDYFRKPNPGMAYDLALSYILDLKQSIMVGDASGRVRKTEDVYADETSPTNWSFKSGVHLTEKEVVRIETFGPMMARLTIRDFSDSDFKFAMNAGMSYIDITDFLFGYREPVSNVTQY